MDKKVSKETAEKLIKELEKKKSNKKPVNK